MVNLNFKNFIKTIQTANLNFLIGSGLSMPFINTLGNIEILITELVKSKELNPKEDNYRVIQASLYRKYFVDVMQKSLEILSEGNEAEKVLSEYSKFLSSLNILLFRRESPILTKEVNLFTTNIDIFLELALEKTSLENNDGFSGRFQPLFSLSNFHKIHMKKSLHFEQISEIPTFNLVKLHGSTNWYLKDDKQIHCSHDLSHIASIIPLVEKPQNFIEIEQEDTIDSLIEKSKGLEVTAELEEFLEAYNRLPIVNPSKEKFQSTLLNQTYYELLRMYANELEKENTVLLVMGFSFADEHIQEITLRAANSNPTLMIIIFAYKLSTKKSFEEKFPPEKVINNNVFIWAPPIEKDENKPPNIIEKYRHDLHGINEHILKKLLASIGVEEE